MSKKKIFSIISSTISLCIIIAVVYIIAKAAGFVTFFKYIAGIVIVGFPISIIVSVLLPKFDRYCEDNKQKKYRILIVYIGIVIGILSGLVYMVPNKTGLFPESSNDFGYSLLVFGFLGFFIGFTLSRFVKIKNSKYYFSG